MVLPTLWLGGAIQGAGCGKRIASRRCSAVMLTFGSLASGAVFGAALLLGGHVPSPTEAATSSRLLTTRAARWRCATASGWTSVKLLALATSMIRSYRALSCGDAEARRARKEVCGKGEQAEAEVCPGKACENTHLRFLSGIDDSRGRGRTAGDFQLQHWRRRSRSGFACCACFCS